MSQKEGEALQINPRVPYIADADLEELANELLERYEREVAPIFRPPAPVEEIADFLLELNLEWLDIADTETEPILAYLDPATKTIRFNERRLAYFEQYPGTYQFTLAHEIGHYQLHLLLEPVPANPVYVYRFQGTPKDRREWQAERFASYLLLPASLLLPAIAKMDLCRWSTLYQLRDQFEVSVTALKIRLEELGYVYAAPNGRLYPNRSAALSDQRQALRHLMSQGQLYHSLGQVAQTKMLYTQALHLAREFGYRREAAALAGQLAQLAGTDPA
ncbi:MAG: ImmA/IrrE family metallo-endopeptidase [Anaerolineae bacterium]|nr:ImmA/IrrE family metallo-endopeptidase [Anaerolineae bacterium]